MGGETKGGFESRIILKGDNSFSFEGQFILGLLLFLLAMDF